MVKSVEEQVEDAYKEYLKSIGVKLYAKTESMGDAIDKALTMGASKSGGSGVNRPDIRFWVDLGDSRRIPVMVEAKGTESKLEKLAKDTGAIEGVTFTKEGLPKYSSITGYAVNGAIHYAKVLLEYASSISAVIAIGVNGYKRDNHIVYEHKVYWVSRDNGSVPKPMVLLNAEGLDHLLDCWTLFEASHKGDLCEYVDSLALTDEERENAKRILGAELEDRIKRIHQRIYDSDDIRNILSTNEKLYLFTALIMAGLPGRNLQPLSEDDLHGYQYDDDNDGETIFKRVQTFLKSRGNSAEKIKSVCDLLKPTLTKKAMWQCRGVSQESLIKTLFRQVNDEILPYLSTNLRLDFTGLILNSLNDWVQIENDQQNDVVLTPRYVTKFMARLARTDMNSFVWDSAMGSAGMLVAALDIMERDVYANIKTKQERDEKIKHIHENQLLGVEILGNIYVLAVLNMILMGDGSSNVKNANSHEFLDKHHGLPQGFPANVFLLNPPYSAPGKGLNFVLRAVKLMETGYACVLIQENAGSGNGGDFARDILKEATLRASIHMPIDLFSGKSNVQTAIYLFECGRPHEEDDMVTFIDMSEDGYARQNRKKSSSKVNLRDDGTADARYDEVVARVLGKKALTDYYTEANGMLICDSITLNGNDWTYQQHKVIDLTPTEEDFRKTVADYLSWRVSQVIAGGGA